VASVPFGELPAWAARWARSVRPGVTPVQITVPGDGNTFHLIAIATPMGVQGLWKETTFDSN